jgi:hypothetical protein
VSAHLSVAQPIQPHITEPEPFVDPDAAARYLRTTRRHVLEIVRTRLIVGHPLNPVVGVACLHAKLRITAT